MITVIRTSQMSGITRELELDITEAQIASWEGGTLIQNAFPQLDAEQREFIKSGITAEEWVELWGED